MPTAHVNVKGRTSMDGSGWAAGLRKMETSTKAATGRMAGSFAGAIGGVFAIGFLTSATRRIVQHADQIDKTAKRIGVSTDAIQNFDFAATQSGANMGDVEKAFFNTAKAIESAKQGLTTHIRAFEAFGITMQMLNVMSPEEVFLKVADAIEKAGGAMDKAKSLQDIMGRGGKSLIPAFTAGFTGLAATAPDPIDAETISKLAAFNDELDRLKREALPAAASAVSLLADQLQSIVKTPSGERRSKADRDLALLSKGLNLLQPMNWFGGVRLKGSEPFSPSGVDENRGVFLGSNLGQPIPPKTDPSTADEAAAAAAKAWAKPSLQLNSLQRIGAAVTQSADPIAIEKDNNKLLQNIARNTKKTADAAEEF